jgi:hypothetical protein
MTKKTTKGKKKSSEIRRRNDEEITQSTILIEIPKLPKVQAQHVAITNPEDVRIEQAEVASYLARYSFAHADAEMQVALAENALEVAKSRAWQSLIDDAGDGRAPSAETLKRLVVLDSDVQKAERRYIRAKHLARQLGGMVKALDKKSDMLVQLGADNRAEYKSHGRD